MKPVKVRAFKDRLKGHKDAVICLYSPNGMKGGNLWTASKEGCIREWDFVERKLLMKMIVSKKGPEVEEKQVDLITEKEEVKKVTHENVENKGHSDSINVFLFNENSVYGGYDDGTICGWNLIAGDLNFILPGHTGQITQLIQLNPRNIISFSVDGTYRVWDTMSGSCETLIKLNDTINYAALENMVIYTLVGNVKLSLFNAENFHNLSTIRLDNIVAINFFISDTIIFFSTVASTVESFTIEDNERITPHGFTARHEGWILAMKINNGYLYTASDDKKIRVWNLKDSQLLEEFVGHDDGVISLEFCDNNLYSGSFDHSIRSWDLKEMYARILDRKRMFREDIFSHKYEAYLATLNKGKKGKKKGKKGKRAK